MFFDSIVGSIVWYVFRWILDCKLTIDQCTMTRFVHYVAFLWIRQKVKKLFEKFNYFWKIYQLEFQLFFFSFLPCIFAVSMVWAIVLLKINFNYVKIMLKGMFLKTKSCSKLMFKTLWCSTHFFCLNQNKNFSENFKFAQIKQPKLFLQF